MEKRSPPEAVEPFLFLPCHRVRAGKRACETPNEYGVAERL